MTCSPIISSWACRPSLSSKVQRAQTPFQKKVEDFSGVKVSNGSHACAEALRTYGGVKKIAVLSPYWPVMNTEVGPLFRRHGLFKPCATFRFNAASWTNIAEQNDATLRDALRKLDGDDVDAIVQVGTNLSMCEAGGSRGNVARQACHRHQHGDLLACAAGQRHSRQDRRSWPPAGRI